VLRKIVLAVPLLLIPTLDAGAALLGDTIKPFVSSSETYDSNVFRVKNQDQLWALVRDRHMGDFINVTEVGSAFHYGLSSLESNLLLKRDFITYSHYSSQSASRDEVDGDVSIRLFDRVRLKADGSYLREPEGRADFRSPGLNEVTTLQYGILAAYETPTGFSFETAYHRVGVDYSLRELKGNEYDLDRFNETVSYRLSPEARVYASYQRDNRNYQQGIRVDDSATLVKSDNVGDSVRVGIEKSFGPKTTVSGYVGYLNRRLDALPARDFSGPIGKAEVRYGVTSKIGVVLNTERDLYEETYPDQIYSVNTSVGAGLVYQATEKVKASVMSRLNWKDFENVPGSAAQKRNDLTRQVNAGVEWTPRDRVSVTVGYQYENRNSNVGSFDYSSHAVTAAVAYKF
jgi:opacity protein-like surface antigen